MTTALPRADPTFDAPPIASESAPERRARLPRPDRTSVVLTLAAWAPMVIWYAAFRPGLMSGDSITVWAQAVHGHWVDLHPPLYTATMWVSDRVVGGPSLVTLGQSLFLAAGVVAAARAVHRMGVNGRVVGVVAGLIVVSPMVGAFSISLWKDVPYTAAFLFAAARLLDVTRARLDDDRALERRSWFALVAWAALMTALRQNGFVLIVALTVLLAVPFRREWRRLLLLVGASLLTLGLLKAVVYPVMGVSSTGSQPTLSLMFHDIAAIEQSDPSALTAKDHELLATVAPPDAWADAFRRFGCTSANWEWEPRFVWANAESKSSDFMSLWLRMLREHPKAVVSNRLCVGAVAWRPDNEGVLYTVSRGVDPNNDGITTEPISGRLHDAAESALDVTEADVAQPFTWRAPLWIYITYVGVGLLAWRTRRWWLIVPLAPLLALQLTVFAANPAQDARYMFGGLMLAVLLLPLVLLPRTEKESMIEEEPALA